MIVKFVRSLGDFLEKGCINAPMTGCLTRFDGGGSLRLDMAWTKESVSKYGK